MQSYIALHSRKDLTVSSLYPNKSCRTSVVCSPRSGGGDGWTAGCTPLYFTASPARHIKNEYKKKQIQERFFSMSRNMRSNLTATDHTYVHSYRRLLNFDMFLNPKMHLKSKQTV